MIQDARGRQVRGDTASIIRAVGESIQTQVGQTSRPAVGESVSRRRVSLAKGKADIQPSQRRKEITRLNFILKEAMT